MGDLLCPQSARGRVFLLYPPLRREGGASTWLPHQHPLWQAAPNADGADVSETVPFFSPISSANFNPEAEESEGVGGRQAADMK